MPERAALITGGSRGIGRGIALELAGLGWDLVINYASNEAAASQTRLDCIARIRITERRLWFIGARSIQRIILLLGTRLITAAHETFAPDFSRSEDRNVSQILAPNQAVVPMTVAKVLILVPFIWLRRIVLRTI